MSGGRLISMSRTMAILEAASRLVSAWMGSRGVEDETRHGWRRLHAREEEDARLLDTAMPMSACLGAHAEWHGVPTPARLRETKFGHVY